MSKIIGMAQSEVSELKIGDIVIKIPIIQGGMGVGISLAELVVAVLNTGCLGILAGAGIGIREPDYNSNYPRASLMGLVHQVLKVRELTKGKKPVALNLMASLSNFRNSVRVADMMGVDILFVGGGFPKDLPSLLLEGSKMKLVPIVSSGKGARILCKLWKERYDRLPDAIVLEGPMAGGHLGFEATEEYPDPMDNPAFVLGKLLADVLKKIEPFEEAEQEKAPDFRIPVIVAGGIYDGSDIEKYIRLGASGVQMGTRFVATDECPVSDEFKRAYLLAERTVIIVSPVGMPGRAIRNKFLDDVAAGKKKPVKCPVHCISSCAQEDAPYCIFFALGFACKGKMNLGFAFAGANVSRIKEIISVQELIDELVSGYKEAIKDVPRVTSQLVRVLDIRQKYLSLDI